MEIQKISNQNFGMRIKDTKGLRDLITKLSEDYRSKDIEKMIKKLHNVESDQFELSIDNVYNEYGLTEITLSHPKKKSYHYDFLGVNGAILNENKEATKLSLKEPIEIFKEIKKILKNYKRQPSERLPEVEDLINFAIYKK